MWRLSAGTVSVGVCRQRLNGIGRTGRLYASTAQSDVKVVSSASADSEQHTSSSSQPPQPTGRGGGGLLWKLIGLSIVGAGGVVGYAWYDADFRKSVEGRIPYAKPVFDYVFEYLPASKPAQPVPALPPKPKSAKESKITSPVVKHEPEQKTATTVPPTEESVLTKEEIEEIELNEKKRREKERLEQAVKLRETEEANENTELEGQLEKLLSNSRTSVSAAISGLKSAALALREHTEQMRRAIEVCVQSDDWKLADDMRPLQSDVVWMSDSAAEHARSDLDRLQTAVTDARSKKSTERNQMLLPTEDELSKLSHSLNLAVSELKRAKSEEKVVMEYRGQVKQGREQFRKELESVVPDVQIVPRLEAEFLLTADELNSLIAHAHRRMEQLEKQLAEQQSAEQQQIDAALSHLKQENELLADERLKQERQKMQAELEMLKQQWVEEAEVERERQLRSEMSRQAAAHEDHVKDVLRVQQHELQTAFDVRLAGLVDRERVALHQKIAGWTGRMLGIDKALADRAEMDKMARKAAELWLACQTLHSVVTEGSPDAGGSVWEDRLKPLQPELETIAAALSEKSELVTTVIGSVPETAVTRGVWTESALAERFARVRSVARRVALIDESGGSLFHYILSYIMSMFVFRQPLLAESAAPSDDDDAELDPDQLTTFVLLDRAADALERGSLEQAVRYVNQLRGESRRVASGWLTEARLLLETRQAAEVLVSFAVANSLGSLA